MIEYTSNNKDRIPSTLTRNAVARRLLSPRGMSQLFHLSNVLHHALDYHVERHNVIASNIANIDTPGFQPFDLLRDSECQLNGSLSLVTSDERHLPRNSGEGAEDALVIKDISVAAGADGNSVSLEREMSKLAANDVRFQSASRLIAGYLAQLRYAASDTSSG
jgi:flagellar basal-body rod protein FlgB